MYGCPFVYSLDYRQGRIECLFTNEISQFIVQKVTDMARFVWTSMPDEVVLMQHGEHPPHVTQYGVSGILCEVTDMSPSPLTFNRASLRTSLVSCLLEPPSAHETSTMPGPVKATMRQLFQSHCPSPGRKEHLRGSLNDDINQRTFVGIGVGLDCCNDS